MQPKNMIIIGIILITWYIPFAIITSILTITMITFDIITLGSILLTIIILSIYTIGLLTINMGLKKIIKNI